jgi:hypothetical protein
MLIHKTKDSNKEQNLNIKKPQQQGPKNGHPIIHEGKEAFMWT